MANHQTLSEQEMVDLYRKIKNDPKIKALGAGTFKTAYKMDDNTVVTLEKLNKGSSSKSKEDYIKLITAFYTLDAKHLKNILVPYASGETDMPGERHNIRIQKLALCADNGYVDLFALLIEGGLAEMKKQNKTALLKNSVGILETIYELHKKNITCMDIKLENTFIKCTDKNYIALGDADGFEIYDSKDKMYKTQCVATPGYMIWGEKFKNHRTDGGPTTDYFAWLKVLLVVYIALFEIDEGGSGMDQYLMSEGFDSYGTMCGTVTDDGYKKRYDPCHDPITSLHDKVVKKIFIPSKDQTLIDLILKAMSACVTDELYKTKPDGLNAFYDNYMKPIVDYTEANGNKIFDRFTSKELEAINNKNVPRTQVQATTVEEPEVVTAYDKFKQRMAKGIKKYILRRKSTTAATPSNGVDTETVKSQSIGGRKRTKKRRRRKRTKKRRKRKRKKTRRKRRR